MKNSINKFVFAILFVLLSLNFSIANEPAYHLSAQNIKYVSANSLEFEIYLRNTGKSDLRYAMGQYCFEFEPKIANGGTLTYSIVNSGLSQELIPKNPMVDGNILRLASNMPPSEMEDLPLINRKSPGTLVARMKLTTSQDKFAETELNLICRLGPGNPMTKVCCYNDSRLVEAVSLEIPETDNIISESLTENILPKEFLLYNNYPNPFNPSTTIKFDLPVESNVNLSIFDITGREISVLVNDKLSAGTHEYKWNAAQLSSGIYFYKIKTESYSKVMKMLLVK
ncbi:MAG: T9SS type A sorting domain-containing protein [Ignavibacteria bacterium]